MGKTNISWCDFSFNPWIGCTKVGPGCDHCYAEAFDARFGGAHWGSGVTRRRTSANNWNQVRRWNAKAEDSGRREKVFCASMADVFDNEVPDAWRADLWELIERCPNLDWILVTKRIGNAARMVPPHWMVAGFPSHIWLLATVVNQDEMCRDVPKLFEIPARIRGLSIEPMLGPITFGGLWHTQGDEAIRHNLPVKNKVIFHYLDLIDWIICGAESGSKQRRFHEAYALMLRDQCQITGTAFFYKQGPGGPAPKYTIETPLLDGRRWMEFPDQNSDPYVG